MDGLLPHLLSTDFSKIGLKFQDITAATRKCLSWQKEQHVPSLQVSNDTYTLKKDKIHLAEPHF